MTEKNPKEFEKKPTKADGVIENRDELCAESVKTEQQSLSEKFEIFFFFFFEKLY